MTLLKYYEAAVKTGDIIDDAIQKEIVQKMQRLDDDLVRDRQSWWPWSSKTCIKGLYIYGPVGVGKTYLADLFYEHVDEPKKARFHFHHFMQQIDAQLRMRQGHKDPLKLIAKYIAKTTRIIFFDEFLVHDVAYAMILAELLQALMASGVIIIFTSNTRPDDLYLNGVQRARFLPAIELIKSQCDVLYLNENKDYRLGRQPLLDAYLYPLNTQTEQKMHAQFAQFSSASPTEPGVIQNHGFIVLQNREVSYFQCNTRAIWFDFAILCQLPRSQLDYLELAERFDALFLSNIPALAEHHTLQVILLVHLVDVLYDRGIKLIISAEVPIEALYVAGEMKQTFKRTLSRLIEMQSEDYLRRHPRRVTRDIV
jgi:cell division protein ZapE